MFRSSYIGKLEAIDGEVLIADSEGIEWSGEEYQVLSIHAVPQGSESERQN